MMENLLENPEQSSVQNKERGAFYKDAANYWSQIPATVDGMLGGYGFISKADISGSTQFLKQLFRLKVPPGRERALDCGAGIGRITENLLFKHFTKVDLVEQDPEFVAQARAALETHPNMGNFFCSGLQNFTPKPATYDIIWCQWVLGHLKDDDLINFLRGCISGLKENGIIVVKENSTTSGKLDEDPTDSSVTRPLDLLCKLLQDAGLRCVKQKRQTNFPHGLYPVYMIATRPSIAAEESVFKADRVEPTSLETELSEPEGKSRGSATVNVPEELVNGLEGSLHHVTDIKENDSVNSGHRGSSVETHGVVCVSDKTEVQLDDDCGDMFEEEAETFNCQVEYSSDDSTKTDISPAELSTCQDSSKILGSVNSSALHTCSSELHSETQSEMKCDIF